MTVVEWDFGDGTTVTDDADVSHTYAAAGDYTASASVDGTVIDTVDVTVTAGGGGGMQVLLWDRSAMSDDAAENPSADWSGDASVHCGVIKAAAPPTSAAGLQYFTVGEVANGAVTVHVYVVSTDQAEYPVDDFKDVATQGADVLNLATNVFPVPPNTWKFCVDGMDGSSAVVWHEESNVYTVTATTFDPGEYVVADVQDHVTEHPDEVQAVYDAERAGKHRVTLMSWLVDQGAR